jgi:hypothetical protein
LVMKHWSTTISGIAYLFKFPFFLL